MMAAAAAAAGGAGVSAVRITYQFVASSTHVAYAETAGMRADKPQEDGGIYIEIPAGDLGEGFFEGLFAKLNEVPKLERAGACAHVVVIELDPEDSSHLILSFANQGDCFSAIIKDGKPVKFTKLDNMEDSEEFKRVWLETVAFCEKKTAEYKEPYHPYLFFDVTREILRTAGGFEPSATIGDLEHGWVQRRTPRKESVRITLTPGESALLMTSTDGVVDSEAEKTARMTEILAGVALDRPLADVAADLVGNALRGESPSDDNISLFLTDLHATQAYLARAEHKAKKLLFAAVDGHGAPYAERYTSAICHAIYQHVIETVKVGAEKIVGFAHKPFEAIQADVHLTKWTRKSIEREPITGMKDAEITAGYCIRVMYDAAENRICLKPNAKVEALRLETISALEMYVAKLIVLIGKKDIEIEYQGNMRGILGEGSSFSANVSKIKKALKAEAKSKYATASAFRQELMTNNRGLEGGCML